MNILTAAGWLFFRPRRAAGKGEKGAGETGDLRSLIALPTVFSRVQRVRDTGAGLIRLARSTLAPVALVALAPSGLYGEIKMMALPDGRLLWWRARVTGFTSLLWLSTLISNSDHVGALSNDARWRLQKVPHVLPQ